MSANRQRIPASPNLLIVWIAAESRGVESRSAVLYTAWQGECRCALARRLAEIRARARGRFGEQGTAEPLSRRRCIHGLVPSIVSHSVTCTQAGLGSCPCHSFAEPAVSHFERVTNRRACVPPPSSPPSARSHRRRGDLRLFRSRAWSRAMRASPCEYITAAAARFRPPGGGVINARGFARLRVLLRHQRASQALRIS